MNHDQISLRAYHLWQANGSPYGRSDEFWNRAEKELLAHSSNVAAESAAQSVHPAKLIGQEKMRCATTEGASSTAKKTKAEVAKPTQKRAPVKVKANNLKTI